MLKNTAIKKIVVGLLTIVLGIFVPKGTFQKLMDAEDENTAEYKFFFTGMTMVSSLAYLTAGFIFEMILFALFAFNSNYFLANFSLGAFLGVAISMLVITNIKYYVLKNFINKNGKKTHVPHLYFYGVWDMDILFSILGGLVIGLIIAFTH